MTLRFTFRYLVTASIVLGGIELPVDIARAADEPGQQLVTRWAKEVKPDAVLPEYPRPQLVRKDWLNLNGSWDLSISETQDRAPDNFSDKILVPYPIESFLGGVQKRLLPSQRAWYRREFMLDPTWVDQNVMLHFGAVDWHAEVWVNGQRVGEHRGGYDPFTFDITEFLKTDAKNTVVVGVSDPSDSGTQPRGKQKSDPEGIWYTPVSGIWQTVWLEPVPKTYVKSLRVDPDLEQSSVRIFADIANPPANAVVRAKVLLDKKVVAEADQPTGDPIVIKIEKTHSWSPNDPALYDLEIEIADSSGKQVDAVSSYFGMRSVMLGTDRNGLRRIMFNGEPLFQYGPLDQGYWPDGLYTAPTDDALRSDLELAKRLGFNMVRKHVKVEPARWYYWCDRMGLIVWQDMPSGDATVKWPMDGVEMKRSEESTADYRAELKEMVDALRHFSCISVWVPFNEAWGQFDTIAVSKWLEEYDPTRLVVSASGGNDFGCGDIKDDHFYPGPNGPPAEVYRAAVLGEFGGLGLPLRGHTWQQERNWGYRSFESKEQLTAAYTDAISKLRPLVESRLSAAVYTQTTDVEVEVNGLVTYDREILKVDEQAVKAANAKLFEPLPQRTDAENVSASVLAWWRFDDGKTGNTVSDLSGQMGAIAAQDYSGHNNHLFAFSPNHAPSVADDVPQRRLGLVPVENRHCLDDSIPPGEGAQTRDLYTNPEVARTHMDQLNYYPLDDCTIEVSICLAQQSGEQIALSKEEDREGTIHPLFQLGVFGSPPQVGVEFVDQAGETVSIHTDVRAEVGKWIHIALTCQDDLAKLYVANDSDGNFVVVGETPVSGSLSRRGGTWSVGRGSEGGKMGRDFVGRIDEVRISTKALDESQFLFGNSQQSTEIKTN